MRSEVLVEIQLRCGDLERLAGSLDGVLPEGKLHAGTYEVRCRRGDPALEEMLAALSILGIEFAIREERNFRARELAEAPALHVEPEVRLRNRGGSTEGRSAVQGACPRCGRGGEQVGDLVIDDVPPCLRGFALTGDGRILVAESLARAMIEERITGCILRPTRDARGGIRDVFQVLPLSTLPPLCVPPTRIGRDPEAGCGTCGRGAWSVHSLLYYDLAPESLADLNVSREALSGIDGRAGGVVVSQRLFRLLDACEALGASVEPVILV